MQPSRYINQKTRAYFPSDKTRQHPLVPYRVREILPASSRFRDGSIMLTRSRKIYCAALKGIRKADFVHHPQVLGYCRYIDDALALVYRPHSS